MNKILESKLMLNYLVERFTFTGAARMLEVSAPRLKLFRDENQSLSESAHSKIRLQFKSILIYDKLEELKKKYMYENAITNYDDDDSLTDLNAPTKRNGSDRTSRSTSTNNNGALWD